jgi:hypothetical protein
MQKWSDEISDNPHSCSTIKPVTTKIHFGSLDEAIATLNSAVMSSFFGSQ